MSLHLPSLSHAKTLNYYMCPEDAGQIIEITYATDEDGLYQRVYDRSDRSEKYYFAKYDMRKGRTEESFRRNMEFSPQNGVLPCVGRWREIVTTSMPRD